MAASGKAADSGHVAAALDRAKARIAQAAINVKDYGAMGDGSTDDTAAIQAAITANPGRTIYIGPGVYVVNPLYQSPWGGITCALKITSNGTQLRLDQSATLKTSSAGVATTYATVWVAANDVTITGGQLIGDLTIHTGATGESGHGFWVLGHRFRAVGVTVRECWGDGFYFNAVPGGTPLEDCALIDCLADSNRRQGASFATAKRPRITGGAYINTGALGYTAPAAGIDLEPNPNKTPPNEITDAVVTGVVFAGNAGAGLLVAQPIGSPAITGNVAGCTMTGNAVGFQVFKTPGAPDPLVQSSGNRMVGNTARVNLGGTLGTQGDTGPIDYTPIVQSTASGDLTGWTKTGTYAVDTNGYVDYQFNITADASFTSGSGIYRIYLPVPALAADVYSALAGAITVSAQSNVYYVPATLVRTSSTYLYFLLPHGGMLDHTGPVVNGTTRPWAAGGFIRGHVRYLKA